MVSSSFRSSSQPSLAIPASGRPSIRENPPPMGRPSSPCVRAPSRSVGAACPCSRRLRTPRRSRCPCQPVRASFESFPALSSPPVVIASPADGRCSLGPPGPWHSSPCLSKASSLPCAAVAGWGPGGRSAVDVGTLAAASTPSHASITSTAPPSFPSLHSLRAPGVLGAEPVSGLSSARRVVASPPPQATTPPGEVSTVPTRLLTITVLAGHTPISGNSSCPVLGPSPRLLGRF